MLKNKVFFMIKTKNQEEKNFDNSSIIKHSLYSLIYVATTKTSDEYAWTTMKEILFELTKKYDFLENVKIKNNEDINYKIDDIKISDNINKIQASKIGDALQDFIDILKERLGSRAGYFFLQEFKQILGEEYHDLIKSMGVDLRLISLKQELKDLESGEYHIKDDRNSNIAYIKKK